MGTIRTHPVDSTPLVETVAMDMIATRESTATALDNTLDSRADMVAKKAETLRDTIIQYQLVMDIIRRS